MIDKLKAREDAEQLAACREDWQRVCDAIEPGVHFDPDEVIARITKPEAAGALAGEGGTPGSRWASEGQPDPHGAQYDCERAALTHGNLTDDELANAVFLCDHRRDLDSIGYLTAAKDRIRWLSRKLTDALSAAPVAAQQPAVVGDEMLHDVLWPYAAEWYRLCERAPHATQIWISGELAEAIVKLASLTPAVTPVSVGGEVCECVRECRRGFDHPLYCPMPWQGPAIDEACHCATCTCRPGMTPAVRWDASAAMGEGAVRDTLIAMGWTPPCALAHQPQDGRKGEDRG